MNRMTNMESTLLALEVLAVVAAYLGTFGGLMYGALAAAGYLA
ncbi:MAG: hypothetical protein ACODAE_03575 [Gemmatimonadota bacterium]